MFFALMVFLCGGLGAMTRFFLDKAMSPRLRTERSEERRVGKECRL